MQRHSEISILTNRKPIQSTQQHIRLRKNILDNLPYRFNLINQAGNLLEEAEAR